MEQLTLPPALDQEIENLWFEGGELVYNKAFEKAKTLMEGAWSKLPSPQENYSHSYWISRHLVEALIGLREFESASEWLKIHKSTALFRIDSGERDGLEGTLYYAQGNLEKAKECFEITNKKSDGRWFKNERLKHYKALLSKDSIRPTELREMIEVAEKEIEQQNYPYALSLMYDAFNIDHMNPVVLFNKGLCHFELNELNHAADAFTRAYMLEGESAFKGQDTKYFNFLKTKIEIA